MNHYDFTFDMKFDYDTNTKDNAVFHALVNNCLDELHEKEVEVKSYQKALETTWLSLRRMSFYDEEHDVRRLYRPADITKIKDEHERESAIVKMNTAGLLLDYAHELLNKLETFLD